MKKYLFLILVLLSGCDESEKAKDGKWAMRCIEVHTNVYRCEYTNGDICYVYSAVRAGGISCKFK